MSESRTFSDISEAVVGRMKELGRTQFGMVFDPPDGASSTATSPTPFGECVVAFVHDRGCSELTLTVIKKPALLSTATLWSGFAAALARCREET